MKEFTIPSQIPEDYDGLSIEGSKGENFIFIEQSGIEGVNLTPDDLLALIREGEYLLAPLRDAYVEEVNSHIVRANEMLLKRLEESESDELNTYLRSNIDRNNANVKKAKGAFYTPQHDLYMALCSGIAATITLLFADERMSKDENLLEALRVIEKPIDNSHMLSIAGLNPYVGGPCGPAGSRMHMTPDQTQVPDAFKDKPVV